MLFLTEDISTVWIDDVEVKEKGKSVAEQFFAQLAKDPFPIHYFMYNYKKAQEYVAIPRDFVRQLVLEGHSERAKDGKGNTPILLAVKHNLPNNVVEFLLDAGAGKDLNSKDAADSEGNRPLHYAAQNGNTDTIKTLISGGAQLEVENADGRTPLNFAALYSNEATVNFMRESFTRSEGESEYLRDAR